jgi:hypothetical protein
MSTLADVNCSTSRGYSMSEHDKDAIIGKAVREQAEASRQVELLRARLNEISADYQRVSYALARAPEKMVAIGETTDAQFSGGELIQIATWVELNQVFDLLHQLRAAILGQVATSQQLAKLRIPSC